MARKIKYLRNHTKWPISIMGQRTVKCKVDERSFQAQSMRAR